MRAACFALALVVSGVVASSAETPSTPRAIVSAAFDRMFNFPSVRRAEFNVFRDGRLVTRRNFDVVYQNLDGRGHTLLRFTDPEYLRGTALLMVERADGTEDIWLYRESARRVRRVNTRQRADSFYGTDFTFEDLEHHDWSLYEISRLEDDTHEGHPVYVLEAVPRRPSQYVRLRMEIEKERLALLELDFYRPGSHVPIKTLAIAPEAIEQRDGVLIPEQMRMIQHGRDGHTEVRFLEVQPDPEITRDVFSAMKLERSNVDLFELVERLKPEGESD